MSEPTAVDSVATSRVGEPERHGGHSAREGLTDVCVAALHFHPVYAGPAVRFRRYASGFRDRDVAMRVFTTAEDSETEGSNPEGDEAAGSTKKGGRWDRVDRIPVFRNTLDNPISRLSGWWEYQRDLTDFCEDPQARPEVLQLLALDPWSTYHLWRIRRLGVPTVYTHTMQSSMSERWWKRTLQRFYWPLPYRFLDCTVVSSTVMRDNLRKIGVRGRIEVIPNGTDTEEFRPASDDEERRRLRREFGLEVGDPVVLFVGSISPRKGVDVLADAWGRVEEAVPGAQLLLVGPDHRDIRPDEPVDDFFEKLDVTVGGLSAPERVVFTGSVDEVARYYRAADVFVFPSRKEGMPNVVPEAYASELPVVMTPFQGLPEEFGRPGEHHLLVERSPREIAQAVIGLLQSKERRRQLGRQAREWTEERLGLETALDRYASLYYELSTGSSEWR